MAGPRIENAHTAHIIEMAKQYGQVIVSSDKKHRSPEEMRAIDTENKHLKEYGVTYSFNEEGYLVLKKL